MEKLSFGKKVKKYFIKRSLVKRQKRNVFDINVADNYTLSPDAPNEINDSHYFVGFNFENDEMFYLRLGRRGGTYDNEIWMVYRDKAGRVFVQENEHIAKGKDVPVKVEIVEAGKLINFSYNGFVYPAEEKANGFVPDVTSKPVPFIIEGEFKGTSDPFEFMHHLAPETLARALCEEPKKNLIGFGYAQQIHYEQAGRSKGRITIGGKSVSFSDYYTVRDHSYGPREWDFFDRYIWTLVVLENGDVFHTSLVRYPILKELKAGFAIRSKKTVSLSTSTSMDVLPITGSVPKSFSMKTTYEDSTERDISCKLDFVVPFIFRGDFSVNEGFSNFTVNGVRGKGIAEFGFNADKNRWKR